MMLDINTKLAIIYPYSYYRVKTLLETREEATLSKISTHKSMIARPSAIKQILDYAGWAERDSFGIYSYRAEGRKAYVLRPGMYSNMVRSENDEIELDKKFNAVAITYELLVNSDIPLDIADVMNACRIKDINRFKKILEKLTWVMFLNEKTIQFIPAECDQTHDESRFQARIKRNSVYYRDNIQSINKDLLLNICYPHLYPRLKNSLEALMEVSDDTDIESIVWYLKEENYSTLLPRATAIKVILDNASWSITNGDGTYSFCDELLCYDTFTDLINSI